LDQMLDHFLSRLAMNIRDHRGQFNIGIFKKLLEAIQFGGLLLDQLLPITGQIPEFTDGSGGE